MDNALLKDREAFLKRALANPSVETKRRPDNAPSESRKKPRPQTPKAPAPIETTSYKSSSTGSQFKFGVLARIVRHMRTRHQDGEIHPLSMEEILDETNQLNVGPKIRNWLQTDALPNNPKVQDTEGKYNFKPPLPVRDKKSLLKLLRQHDMKGLGGVMLEDIQESVPHHEKVVKHIDKEILRIVRQTDKKHIVFYHDKSLKFELDKEFQQLWRNTSVDGLQDDHIEDYLNRQGIKSMQETVNKNLIPKRKKTKNKKRQMTKISDNEHLAEILIKYDEQ